MALATVEPWAHFGATEGAALSALRARMGATYASSPVDDDLKTGLANAVARVNKATGRFFVKRTGSLSVDGHGTDTLVLPHAVVSSDQGGNGITQILIEQDTTAVDSGTYDVIEGAEEGPEDPRDRPRVIFRHGDSLPGTAPTRTRGSWPAGRRNIHVTGDFGYLDEAGNTPELVLELLARLVIRQLVALDDEEGQASALYGFLTSDSVQGRTWTLDPRAVGTGMTGDRQIDSLITAFRRPPRVRVANGKRRRRRRGTRSAR